MDNPIELLSNLFLNFYLHIAWILSDCLNLIYQVTELLFIHFLDLVYPLAKLLSTHCPHSYLFSFRNFYVHIIENLIAHYQNYYLPIV